MSDCHGAIKCDKMTVDIFTEKIKLHIIYTVRRPKLFSFFFLLQVYLVFPQYAWLDIKISLHEYHCDHQMPQGAI